MSKKMTILAVVALITGVISLGGVALGATLVVDDDAIECPGAAYATISLAVVAAAISGDTIQVCAGTYQETVTIDKSLDLVGKGAVIQNPGWLMYGIDLVLGTTGVSISGFEITGFSNTWGAGIRGELWIGSDPASSNQLSNITILRNNIHHNYDGINLVAWNYSTWSPPSSWRHTNITIQHNRITDNTYRGVSLWGVSNSTFPSTGNTFAHNQAVDNPSWDVGIYGSTSGNIWVKNQCNDSNTPAGDCSDLL